jgi:hypothetical protein
VQGSWDGFRASCVAGTRHLWALIQVVKAKEKEPSVTTRSLASSHPGRPRVDEARRVQGTPAIVGLQARVGLCALVNFDSHRGIGETGRQTVHHRGTDEGSAGGPTASSSTSRPACERRGRSVRQEASYSPFATQWRRVRASTGFATVTHDS